MTESSFLSLKKFFQTYFGRDMDEIIGTTNFLLKGLADPNYRKVIAHEFNLLLNEWEWDQIMLFVEESTGRKFQNVEAFGYWIMDIENNCLLHLVLDDEDENPNSDQN